jgi:carbon monoxide dehydrogenase subunit G
VREETKVSVVHLPAEDVWDYLSDYNRVVRLGWDDASAERIKPTLDRKVRYRVKLTWVGFKVSHVVWLQEAERPTRVTWATREGGSSSWVRFDLRALDEATTEVRVTLHLEAKPFAIPSETMAWELLRPSFIRTVSRVEQLSAEG